jgi:hypothetical protein
MRAAARVGVCVALLAGFGACDRTSGGGSAAADAGVTVCDPPCGADAVCYAQVAGDPGTCVPVGDGSCDPAFGAGQTCAEGQCVVAGRPCPDGCGQGEVCQDGQCMAPQQSDCPGGCPPDQTCVGGACQSAGGCVPPCQPGQTCVDGACQGGTGGGMQPPPMCSPACDAGQTCVDGRCLDMGCGELGCPCTNDADPCATACVAPPDQPTGFCTVVCTDDQPCPGSGYACCAAQSGTKYCFRGGRCPPMPPPIGP